MRSRALLFAAAVVVGSPSMALAQSGTPPHQHDQPAAAAQMPQDHSQRRDVARSGQPQGEQAAECDCCEMMRQMMTHMMQMMQHHRHGPSAPGSQHQPPANGPSRDHQGHPSRPD